MKRSFAQWRLLFLMIVLFVTGTVFFTVDYPVKQPVQFNMAATAALAGVETLLTKITFPDDFSKGLVIRATTVSSSSYGFSIKQITPSWGRALAAKRTNLSLGFFFPTMVLLMFFRFYQSARTSSESEPAPGFMRFLLK